MWVPFVLGAVRSFQHLSTEVAFYQRPWSGNVFVFDPGFSGVNGMDAHHHSVECNTNCIATGHGPCFGP